MDQNSPHDLPQHIAVIMDGNGRWAKARRLPRTAGHKKGIESTKSIVRHAGEIGLKYLTLYAFSTENWKRPATEITDLMGLLRYYLKSEMAELHKNNVRLRVIGFRDRLSDDIVSLITQGEDLTAGNTGLNLTVALDYGGRQEIVRAVARILSSQRKLGSEASLSRDPSFRWDDNEVEKALQDNLFTSSLPDPDLIIRTSGEQRISNFLLWQSAYSEFIFSDILWPDFTPQDFDAAITEYFKRDRRFGHCDSESVQTS